MPAPPASNVIYTPAGSTGSTTANLYTRITTPIYWVDENGYSHITAPFGGSIIITDKPLTKR